MLLGEANWIHEIIITGKTGKTGVARTGFTQVVLDD